LRQFKVYLPRGVTIQFPALSPGCALPSSTGAESLVLPFPVTVVPVLEPSLLRP
jgi:hypothetical protein